MFNRNIKTMADVTPVRANTRATYDIPRDGAYHQILMYCVDATGAPVSPENIIAGIGEIVLRHNGDDIMQLDAELAYKWYEMYYDRFNVSRVPGVLPLIFACEHWIDQPPADRTAHGLANISAPQFEINFKAAIGGAGQISNVRMYRDNRAVGAAQRGVHRRLKRYNRNQTSIGTFEIDELPIVNSPTTGTIAHHIVYDGSGGAVIERVELVVNQNVIVDVNPQIMRFLMEQAGRKWQDDASARSIFTIPYDLGNDQFSYLVHSGIAELRLRVRFAGAAPNLFEVYVESYEDIGSENA